MSKFVRVKLHNYEKKCQQFKKKYNFEKNVLLLQE